MYIEKVAQKALEEVIKKFPKGTILQGYSGKFKVEDVTKFKTSGILFTAIQYGRKLIWKDGNYLYTKVDPDIEA